MAALPQPVRIAPEPPAPEREALLAALGEDPPCAANALDAWAEAGLQEATERDPAP